ncbi:MAG TPA: bifunctional 4-hydroxy-2-oxoglutarate aldolase/2-dehydro-3-deoxy-phosphogluconate aldolase [Bacteroidota bacterium]|nr:bifunctional 4-hydroxy-2-oxoglutarate aldolase/2-dehydro-3-deoxy-phosphogluconate aldolase [Bacteroidota bacterium]
MSKAKVLDTLLERGIVAVVRLSDGRKLRSVVEAIAAGGVNCIEITMTVPGAIGVISDLAANAPGDVLIGAGTVLDPETALAVIRAGAEFVVSPIFNPEVIEVCKTEERACIPGCFSPTEIYTAWKAGADIIKVFPARSLTPRFLRDIAGPLPGIRLMPTGGVTIENAGEWKAAGAVAIGIGTELLEKKAIAEGRFAELTDRAKRLVQNYHARPA